MSDADRALSHWAKEDGGVRFECRPRGWPGLGLVHLALVLALLGPFVPGWWDVLALRIAARDHVHGWQVTVGEVVLRVEDGGLVVSATVLGPAWGPESPLLTGLVVPYLLLGVIGVAVLEAVRYARRRSRRLLVTSRRLLVTEGLLAPWACAVEPRRGSAASRVVDGPGGARLLFALRPRIWTLVHGLEDAVVAPRAELWLGGLDPLDLTDLARALGASPPEPPAPRPRRLRAWHVGAAVGLVAALCAVAGVHLTDPERARLRIERDEDDLELHLDTPAWGPLRAQVHLWEFHPPARWAPGPDHCAWLPRLEVHEGRATVVHPSRATGSPLRRRAHARVWYDVEVSPVLGTSSRPLPHAPVRVRGEVQLVEGPPLAFDVIVGPGEAVTLDLGDLRAQAR